MSAVSGHHQVSELANQELIGINEQVDQNEFGASLTLDLDLEQAGGQITQVTLIATEDGSGAILGNAITLYFFRSDPSITVGTSDLTAANANLCVGKIEIYEGDWETFTSAGIATVATAFEFLTDTNGDLFCAAVNRSATSYNSAAGDDEQLEMTIQYTTAR